MKNTLYYVFICGLNSILLWKLSSLTFTLSVNENHRKPWWGNFVTTKGKGLNWSIKATSYIHMTEKGGHRMPPPQNIHIRNRHADCVLNTNIIPHTNASTNTMWPSPIDLFIFRMGIELAKITFPEHFFSMFDYHVQFQATQLPIKRILIKLIEHPSNWTKSTFSQFAHANRAPIFDPHTLDIIIFRYTGPSSTSYLSNLAWVSIWWGVWALAYSYASAEASSEPKVAICHGSTTSGLAIFSRSPLTMV